MSVQCLPRVFICKAGYNSNISPSLWNQLLPSTRSTLLTGQPSASIRTLKTALFSSLWVSRTGSASDFCALQEALYKCIGTIQYNSTLDYSSFLEGVPLIMWPNHFLCGLRIIPIRDVCRHFKKHFCNRRFTPHTQPHLGVPNHRSSHLVHVTFLTVTLMQP